MSDFQLTQTGQQIQDLLNQVSNNNFIKQENSLPTATATSPDFVQVSGVTYQKKVSGSPATYTYQALGEVTSLGGAVGDITLGDGLEIANGELSLESKRKVIASITLDAETNSIVINNLNIDSSKRIFYHIVGQGLSTTENVFIQINDITSTYIDSAVWAESNASSGAVKLENVMFNWQTGFFVCYVKNTSEKFIADGTIENSNGTLIHKNLAVCIGDTNVPSTYRNNAGFLKNNTITSISKINIFTNNANFPIGTKILIYTEDV